MSCVYMKQHNVLVVAYADRTVCVWFVYGVVCVCVFV